MHHQTPSRPRFFEIRVPGRVGRRVSAWAAAALIVATLSVSGCQKASKPATSGLGGDVLASVNGETISVEQFEQAFSEARTGKITAIPEDPMTQLQIKAVFLSEMVETILLKQQAVALGVTVTPEDVAAGMDEMAKAYPDGEFEAMLRREQFSRTKLEGQIARQLLIDRVIQKAVLPGVRVDDSEVFAEYRLQADRFQVPEKVRANQILVTNEADAEKILVELYGGADFADLARRFSKAPEARLGGDLGFFAAGEMPEVIAKNAFTLTVGQTSGILRSEYGFHILRVTDRHEAHRLELEKVRGELVDEIRERKAKAAFEDYMEKIRVTADVRYNEDLLAEVRLS
ncbi:MAG: peptidylprolyl isomerase [Deltaproteobacteria bacterium]|nr:peptidylprolyl isomerase [Deltaproteobacteria bacterium]